MLVPDSIVSDGSVDVTAPIQEWIDGAPDGATLEFVKGATYRIDETLVIRDREGLILNGHGSTFRAVTEGTRNRSVFRIRNSRNIICYGLLVVGANPNGGTGDKAYVSSLEAQHGFEIDSSTKVVIDRCTVTNPYGDFVYLSNNGTGRVWCDDITIKNSSFTQSGRHGIAITGARNVCIVNCGLGRIRRTAVNIEPNTASGGAENVWVRGCRIGTHRLNFLSIGNEGSVHTIVVANNEFRSTAMNSSVQKAYGSNPRRRNIHIVDNVSFNAEYGDNDGAVMGFHSVDRVTVLRNSHEFQTGRNMVLARFYDCTDVEYDGETWPGLLWASIP